MRGDFQGGYAVFFLFRDDSLPRGQPLISVTRSLAYSFIYLKTNLHGMHYYSGAKLCYSSKAFIRSRLFFFLCFFMCNYLWARLSVGQRVGWSVLREWEVALTVSYRSTKFLLSNVSIMTTIQRLGFFRYFFL